MRKILLLPFCLSRAVQGEIGRMAAENGYSVVVAVSTARALTEVRQCAGRGSGETVRIVGVVCEGRAKKVFLGLLLLKIRQWLKKALGFRVRRIELARVAVPGGPRGFFGRRNCRVGFNVADVEGLRRALAGEETHLTL